MLRFTPKRWLHSPLYWTACALFAVGVWLVGEQTKAPVSALQQSQIFMEQQREIAVSRAERETASVKDQNTLPVRFRHNPAFQFFEYIRHHL